MERAPHTFCPKSASRPVAVSFFFVCRNTFQGSKGLWAGPFPSCTCRMTRAEARHVLHMIAVGMIVGSRLHQSSCPSRGSPAEKGPQRWCRAVCFTSNPLAGHTALGLPDLALRGVLDLLDVVHCSSGDGLPPLPDCFLLTVRFLGGHGKPVPFGRSDFRPIVGRLLDVNTKTTTGAYSLTAARCSTTARRSIRLRGGQHVFHEEIFPWIEAFEK